MRDIRRTAVTEQLRILKMTLRVIFSILNNLSLRRNIYLNIQNFTRENKPLSSFFFSISGRHVGAPQRSVSILSSVNLCGTFCQITRVRNTAQT